ARIADRQIRDRIAEAVEIAGETVAAVLWIAGAVGAERSPRRNGRGIERLCQRIEAGEVGIDVLQFGRGEDQRVRLDIGKNARTDAQGRIRPFIGELDATEQE